MDENGVLHDLRDLVEVFGDLCATRVSDRSNVDVFDVEV